jgi:hypothetical protein
VVIHSKDPAVSDSRFPFPSDPDDTGDLPDVFEQLTGIDVVDGELIPRAPKPASG